jgi:hypothetical protein
LRERYCAQTVFFRPTIIVGGEFRPRAELNTKLREGKYLHEQSWPKNDKN